MSERSVWLVSRGDYSDYRIVAVFTSRELAEQAVALWDTDEELDEHEIEEYALDPYQPQIRAGLLAFDVYMHRDGGVSVDDSDPGEEPLKLRSRADGEAVAYWLAGTVWAKDKQHAAKIAHEKRSQLIASGEWPSAP